MTRKLGSIEEVLKQARAISLDVLGPEAEKIDRAAQWPEAGMRALQQGGLTALVAPSNAGGLAYGLLALAQTCEVMGQECPSTSMCFGMHTVGTAVLAAKATSLQTQEYLVPIVEGRHLTTLALSEPGTGAHFYFPETTLVQQSAEEFAITGTKSFVTNGGHADSYVVSTVASAAESPIGKFSCVVVRDGSSGLTWMEPWEGFGMRGNASRSMRLEQVKIPRSNLLGEEGDQIWYVFEIVAPYFLMAMAGTYLGIATSALNEVLAHLKTRHYSRSGAALSQLPVLQHRVGALWAQVERTRRFLYSAASQGDQGHADALPAILSAKAEVADCAVNVVNEVMTLMGGIGYAKDSKLGRHLRDARAAHVMGPTTDMLRTWTGRAILGLPLLGD